MLMRYTNNNIHIIDIKNRGKDETLRSPIPCIRTESSILIREEQFTQLEPRDFQDPSVWAGALDRRPNPECMLS